MNMARSTFYKRPHAGHRAAREKADTDLRVRIEDILAEFPAYGYRRVTHELRRRGLVINHKRVARVMREPLPLHGSQVGRRASGGARPVHRRCNVLHRVVAILGLSVLLASAESGQMYRGDLLHRERTFFGIYRVSRDVSNQVNHSWSEPDEGGQWGLAGSDRLRVSGCTTRTLEFLRRPVARGEVVQASSIAIPTQGSGGVGWLGHQSCCSRLRRSPRASEF